MGPLAWLLGGAFLASPSTPNPSETTTRSTATPPIILAETGGATPEHRHAQEVMRSFVSAETETVEVSLPPQLRTLAEQARWASDLAQERAALGVFWIDLTDGDDVLLYLAVPSGDRVLARTIPRDAQNPAATWDALGVITGSISSALVGGAEVGMVEVQVEQEPEPEPEPEPEVEPVLPTPEASPPPPRDVPPPKTPQPQWQRIGLSVGYIGASFANHAVWTSRIGLGIDWRIRPVPYVGLHYGWGVPIRVSDPDVAFAVDRHVVEARGGARLPASQRITVDLEGFGALDVQRSRSLRALPGIERQSATRPVWATGLRSRVRLRVSASVEIFGSVGVEAALNRFDYVVFSPNGADVRLSPHMIRGELSLGAAFGFVNR